MRLVGELDAGNRHVQFDERGRETECWPSAPSHRARPRLYHRVILRRREGLVAFWVKRKFCSRLQRLARSIMTQSGHFDLFGAGLS